jgi:ADP-ribosyl-[dinitrogen reductase] hydrolase
MEDRARGCLFGLAIGDALGAAVEYQAPGSFPPVTGYRSSGSPSRKPGEWTEDTSMAIALADSIATKDWDLHDQSQRYLDWWRNGKYALHGKCTTISNTVVSALYQFEQARDPWKSGENANSPESNGSIARLAPVAIRFASQPLDVELLSRRALQSSLPTHSSHQSTSACRYLAAVLAGLLVGVERQEVLSPNWSIFRQLTESEELHPHVATVTRGSFRQLQPPDIQGSYYASKCLEAALWAFHNAKSFSEAVMRAVNLGHDANTAGAVCGQLAGAYWGYSGIPRELIDGLAGREMIEFALSGLLPKD